MRRFLRALAAGPPGWVWASALTTTGIYQELTGNLTTQFVTLSSVMFTAWLAYRGVAQVMHGDGSTGVKSAEYADEHADASRPGG